MIINDLQNHNNIINDLLKFINSHTDRFILKGGVAFHLCYGLDRFSKDIDFDSEKGVIFNLIKKYCALHKYKFNIKKYTCSTQRCMIYYADEINPLKIEVSTREKNIDPTTITTINKLKVYKIDSLVMLKLNAFIDRDRIRDAYDVAYIVDKFWGKLKPFTRSALEKAIKERGIPYFDQIINNQTDPLINKEKMETRVLKIIDKFDTKTKS